MYSLFSSKETHQELADRKQMHVVEVREGRGNFPVVVASPSDGFVREKFQHDERDWLNVDYMYSGAKIKLERPRHKPIWVRDNYVSWQRKCVETARNKGQVEARMERIINRHETTPEEYNARIVHKEKKKDD